MELRWFWHERRALYEQVVQTWGEQAEVMMVVEELGEVLSCLGDLHRAPADLKDDVALELASEIADAHNVLEGLTVMLGLEDQVAEERDAKLDRLQHRVRRNLHAL